MKLKTTKSLIISSLIAASSLTFADPYYASLDIVRSEIDLGVAGVDDTDTTFSLAGGYRINENFAVELGYIDFGEISVSGNGSASVEADAIQLAAVGILPLADNAGLFAKLGVDFWDAKLSYTSVPGFGSGSESDDGSDIYYGIGGFYNVTEAINVHMEYLFHELDDVDVDTLSLGLSYSF